MADLTLPVRRAPTDLLRDGFDSLEWDAKARMPAQAIVDEAPQQKWDSKLATVERVYGAGMGLRLRMERAILSQVSRPVLPNSMSGLDTIMGRDETIEWEDIMGDPKDRPEMPMLGLHDVMERRHGVA